MRRYSHIFQSLAVVFDATAIAASWTVAYLMRFRLGLIPFREPSRPELVSFLKLLPIIIACHLLAAAFLGLYRREESRSRFNERVRIVQAACLGWLTMVAALYYYRGRPYSRIMLFIFMFLNPVGLMASRAVLRRMMGVLGKWGVAVQRVAIVGTGRLARRALHRLAGNPLHGLVVEYFIGEAGEARKTDIRGVPVLGSLADLTDCVRHHPVDTVLVALQPDHAHELETVLSALAKLPVQVAFIPSFAGVPTVNLGVFDLEGLPMIRLRGSPIEGWNAVAKRAIDVLASLLLLLAFGLPMLMLALLIKLSGCGPVFYRQVRMGLGGRPFTMLKFRTMLAGAEAETGPVWARDGDPRRTRIGAFLRRTSLDELPQLINVLRGEMSLVGPRPERPHFIRQFADALPAYMLRHDVKAGVTGWAQINGLRGNTSPTKRLDYDLYYINNWSLGLDLLILLLTPFLGLVHRNAY